MGIYMVKTARHVHTPVSYTHLDVYKRQSIHEQIIVLRILEACQAELKGVKLKVYAGSKRNFEHGLSDVDAQTHVSDVIFSGRDYNEIIAALDSLAGRFFTR